MNVPRGQVLVLYGITGDLAKKMIIPALYGLTARGVLDMPVIGVAHGDVDITALRKHAHDSVAMACGRVDEDVFGAFAGRLVSVSGEVTDAAVYTELARHIGDDAFAVHYLAVPPALFAPIADGLGAAGLNTRARLVVEKPFGHDIASARRLNTELHRYFPEERRGVRRRGPGGVLRRGGCRPRCPAEPPAAGPGIPDHGPAGRRRRRGRTR
jgi:glucose-6-phosphate 1-dehydrogenase